MKLWSKNGGPPQALPDSDLDAKGDNWTDLANHADAREACGWIEVEAPDQASVPDPGPPAAFYLSKTLWEDRLSDAQFVAFDGVRLAVLNRPSDWATAADFAPIRPFVRPMLRYESADRVNVRDAGLVQTVQGFAQAHPEVFGDDPAPEIARLLSPELTQSEREATTG